MERVNCVGSHPRAGSVEAIDRFAAYQLVSIESGVRQLLDPDGQVLTCGGGADEGWRYLEAGHVREGGRGGHGLERWGGEREAGKDQGTRRKAQENTPGPKFQIPNGKSPLGLR